MAGLELVVTREQAGRTVKSLLRGELGISTALMGRLKRTGTGLTVRIVLCVFSRKYSFISCSKYPVSIECFSSS